MGESQEALDKLAGRDINAVVSVVRVMLEDATSAREEALRRCRATIQHASKAIRALHRGDTEEASRWLQEARDSAQSLNEYKESHPAVYHAGYIHDAQKEYAEAALLQAILTDGPLPGPVELEVEPAAYLNGLAEAASELRRHILDLLKAGRMVRAEEILSVMDDIYSELIACDYPDAVTGGLRRTTDALRAVLERTHGDVAVATVQRSLQDALERYGEVR